MQIFMPPSATTVADVIIHHLSWEKPTINGVFAAAMFQLQELRNSGLSHINMTGWWFGTCFEAFSHLFWDTSSQS